MQFSGIPDGRVVAKLESGMMSSMRASLAACDLVAYMKGVVMPLTHLCTRFKCITTVFQTVLTAQ